MCQDSILNFLRPLQYRVEVSRLSLPPDILTPTGRRHDGSNSSDPCAESRALWPIQMSIELVHKGTYIHTYVHRHTYMRTYIHTYIHAHAHISAHTYTYTCAYTYTYIHIQTYIHTYIRTYIPALDMLHTFMRTCIHMYICYYKYLDLCLHSVYSIESQFYLLKPVSGLPCAVRETPPLANPIPMRWIAEPRVNQQVIEKATTTQVS